MNNYKFRAECFHDIKELCGLLNLHYELESVIITPDIMFPDCVAEIRTPLSLEDVREFMRHIPDGHVMVQSLQLPQNYTEDREDYATSPTRELPKMTSAIRQRKLVEIEKWREENQ